VDGSCRKIYRGSGFAGKAAADKAAAKGERKALQSIAVAKLVDTIAAAERLFSGATHEANSLMEAGLLANDCYQASYAWRRRRQG